MFMPVPFNTCVFTNDILQLRALSNELAKTTQEASGSTDYGALTTAAKHLRSSSESGQIIHLNRENGLLQEKNTLEDVLKNVRITVASAVASVLNKSSKWMQDHLNSSKLKKMHGNESEKLERVLEDLKLLMFYGYQFRPDDDRDLGGLNIAPHIALKVCYGHGHFAHAGAKSNLILSTNLRGTMELLSPS